MTGFNGTLHSRSTLSKSWSLQTFERGSCNLLHWKHHVSSLSRGTKKISTSQRLIWGEKKVSCTVGMTLHQQCRPITVWLSKLLCLCAQRNTPVFQLCYNKYVQHTSENVSRKGATVVPRIETRRRSRLKEAWGVAELAENCGSTWSQGHLDLCTAHNSRSLAVEISTTEQR